METINLFDDYKRLYNNYDECLRCFEQIMEECSKQKNKKIANIIKYTLTKLK